jgi:flagellar biosynthetic protein FliP
MSRLSARFVRALLFGVLALGGLVAVAGPAQAAQAPTVATATTPTPKPTAKPTAPKAGAPKATAPKTPVAPKNPAAPAGDATVKIDLEGVTGGKPSSSVTVILGITLLSVAPALLLMMTSFTKIIVVLSLTRNALGLQGVPPNQVLAGLALFLSLFVMGPVLSDVNDEGVQPYLKGDKSQSVAFSDGVEPLRTFMLDHTRSEELAMLSKVADQKLPEAREDVPLTTLIPAFVLSELKSAFIIGFVIFVPFLIIDLVVSAALMSMGMMMLPPVMVSLAFKILLFVLVDGWGLIVTALVESYQ